MRYLLDFLISIINLLRDLIKLLFYSILYQKFLKLIIRVNRYK